MNEPRTRAALTGALVLLALAGSLVHPRLPSGALANQIVSGSISFTDLFLVTALFMRRRTALYGFMLNGLFVLFGTVMMGHYSIARYLAAGEKTSVLFLNPGFEGMVTAWADFFVGYALWRAWMAAPEGGTAAEAAMPKSAKAA
jgi:hypothetical protein